MLQLRDLYAGSVVYDEVDVDVVEVCVLSKSGYISNTFFDHAFL